MGNSHDLAMYRREIVKQRRGREISPLNVLSLCWRRFRDCQPRQKRSREPRITILLIAESRDPRCLPVRRENRAYSSLVIRLNLCRYLLDSDEDFKC